MSIGRIGISLVAATCMAEPTLAATDICHQFIDTMENGHLYAAPAGCHSAGCLFEINADGSSEINKGKIYSVLYRTRQTPVMNSIVVVELKHLGKARRETVADVELSRQELSFACIGTSVNVAAPAIPPTDIDPDRFPSVTYQAYDDFHRNRRVDGADGDYLQGDYHIRYSYDGRHCHSTRSGENLPRFLLTDREEYLAGFSVFLSRWGFVDEAMADVGELLKYDKLHVRMANYTKSSQTSG